MGALYQNSVCKIAAATARNALEGCFAVKDPLTYAWCRIAGSDSNGVYAGLARQSTGGRNVVLHHSPLIESA